MAAVENRSKGIKQAASHCESVRGMHTTLGSGSAASDPVGRGKQRWVVKFGLVKEWIQARDCSQLQFREDLPSGELRAKREILIQPRLLGNAGQRRSSKKMPFCPTLEVLSLWSHFAAHLSMAQQSHLQHRGQFVWGLPLFQ